MKNIVTFHGSPGVPADFLAIKEEIKKQQDNLGQELSWTNVDRKDWPNDLAELKKCFNELNLGMAKNDQVVPIGYSYGAVIALAYAALTPAVKKIVLISPYLYPSKMPSKVMQQVLEMPILGHLILSALAPKAIAKMLVQTAAPAPVPVCYLQQKAHYQRPKRLKKALLEKNISSDAIAGLLKELQKRGVVIEVILGDQDQTSSYAQQISPLKQVLPIKESLITKAGHAIIMTHPRQVAKILQNSLSTDKDKQENTDVKNKIGFYPGESEHNNVCSFLLKHLQTSPDKNILTWVPMEEIKAWAQNPAGNIPHKSITVRQLDHLVGMLAQSFIELGIKKNDRAIVFIPMTVELYVSMFALQKIGAIPVFMDSWARRDQLGVSAKAADPKIILSVEKAFQYLHGVAEIDEIPIKIVAGPTQSPDSYSAQLEKLIQNTQCAPITPVASEHTALITFTTGSSGTPKGADRTHRFLASQHYALNHHLPYTEKDSDLPVFPIFSLNNLAAGVTTVIPAIDVGVPNEMDPVILLAQFKATGLTCTTLSPSLLNSVSNYCLQKNIKLPFLRRIITGGAPISRDDLLKITEVCPHAEVLVLYGSTEVEPMAHIEAQEMINLKSRAMQDSEWVDEGVNVGKMDEGLQVKFLKIEKGPIFVNKASDWQNLEVLSGEVGEIIVSGDHVCQGYYNNPEAFSRAKIKDDQGIIWHRTGDLGRYDQDNNLWLVGRVHNAINRAGKYFFPVRAEIVLKKLPFVKLAAYLGMPDPKLGEKTYCVVTLTDPTLAETKKAEYEKEVARIMEKNGIIFDRLIMTDNIPMDPRHHSKVEYEVLRNNLIASGLS